MNGSSVFILQFTNVNVLLANSKFSEKDNKNLGRKWEMGILHERKSN